MPAYLIAYDIGSPKRLRRVAKQLERKALRCQYSVFLFRGETSALHTLMAELQELILPSEDVIQAWQIPPGISPEEIALGAVRPMHSAAVIVATTTRLVFPPNSIPPTPGDS